MDPDTRKARFRAGQSGQGFVEFALILPVLLLLTWGIVEFGRLLLMYTEVSNAAREAVRYGVARGIDPYADPNYMDCQGIRDAGKATTVLTPLEDDNFEINYDHGGGAIIGSCDGDDPPEGVQLGDRLLITVTYEVAPLILFQDSGPFQVQFNTARTIVHEGIPMDDGGGAGEVPDAPILDVTYNPDACEAFFTWDYEGEVEGFNLYRIEPLPVTQVNDQLIVGNRYPAEGYMPVQNGWRYQVRAVNESGEGPPSNSILIDGCTGLIAPPNFQFFRTGYFPSCHGYFTWGDVPDAVGYHMYQNGTPVGGDLATPRFPIAGDYYDIADGDQFEVRAFNSVGAEGPGATLTIEGCTLPPLTPPTGFNFIINQTFLPCNGHFTWNSVTGAEKYYIYQNGVYLDQVTTTRYPAAGNTYWPVLNGDQYNVTAWNPAEESGFSDPVIISGCTEGGQTDVDFYLHSNPTPPTWHGNAPPPLTMNPTGPAHDNLYNYNTTDPDKPGREVTKNGGTPPGETNPDKYLEWRGGPYAQSLTLLSDAMLTIYGKNPLNQDVTAYYYLYDRSSGGGYTLLGSATYVWPKQGVNWKFATVNLGGAGYTLQPGHQLVVWTTSDSLKNVQFAYDTQSYQSKLEFTGEW